MFGLFSKSDIEAKAAMIMKELQCFQKIRHAGTSPVSKEKHAFVSNHLKTFGNPTKSPRVKVQNLAEQTELNGKFGRRDKFSREKQRYLIRFDDQTLEPMWLKSDNLEMRYDDDTTDTLDTIFSKSPFHAFKILKLDKGDEGRDGKEMRLINDYVSFEKDNALWKKWRQCTTKLELQQNFVNSSEALYSSLREKYAALQGVDMIPVLLQIALSSVGDNSEWYEQSFENENCGLQWMGRVGGVAAELDHAQLHEHLTRSKNGHREILLVRVLNCPVSPEKAPELYNQEYAMQPIIEKFSHKNIGNDDKRWRHYCDVISPMISSFYYEQGTTAGSVAEEELKKLFSNNKEDAALFEKIVERAAQVHAERMMRVNALHALVPQLSLLSPKQAKWFVCAIMHTTLGEYKYSIPSKNQVAQKSGSAQGHLDPNVSDTYTHCIRRDSKYLNGKLPTVIVEALVSLFQEGDFIDNDGSSAPCIYRVLFSRRQK